MIGFHITPSFESAKSKPTAPTIDRTMLCLQKVSARIDKVDTLNICKDVSTYAIIFTSFPLAFAEILWMSFSARASTDPEAGTAATMTSMPFAFNASVMPLQ
jgi:hypothetical protein